MSFLKSLRVMRIVRLIRELELIVRYINLYDDNEIDSFFRKLSNKFYEYDILQTKLLFLTQIAKRILCQRIQSQMTLERAGKVIGLGGAIWEEHEVHDKDGDQSQDWSSQTAWLSETTRSDSSHRASNRARVKQEAMKL